jgi:hypothetical protein
MILLSPSKEFVIAECSTLPALTNTLFVKLPAGLEKNSENIL